MTQITAELIQSMPYIDFVGLINQWNTLPGAYSTLSKWATMTKIDSQSNVLEVACTTGFSSRELAGITGCKATGFDRSARSVEMANYNHHHYAKDLNLVYRVADGTTTEFTEKFTHIIVGASLGFFPNPDQMLTRCISWIQDGGYILASPFYAAKQIPESLIEHCRTIFGISITTKPYHEIMQPYRSLETIFEERNVIVPESEEEIRHYVESTVTRACNMLSIHDKKTEDAIKLRLTEIKLATNALREFQEYSVLALRYRTNVYPSRYAELF